MPGFRGFQARAKISLDILEFILNIPQSFAFVEIPKGLVVAIHRILEIGGCKDIALLSLNLRHQLLDIIEQCGLQLSARLPKEYRGHTGNTEYNSDGETEELVCFHCLVSSPKVKGEPDELTQFAMLCQVEFLRPLASAEHAFFFFESSEIKR